MYYFDSAYVAKCYLNDPDSEAVRELVREPVMLFTSAIAVAEVGCAIHRRHREKALSRRQAGELLATFRLHVEEGIWTLVPLTDGLLWELYERLRTLSPRVLLRTGDAIHLASAKASGFREIWSNDHHLLAAAAHFDLAGHSV